MMVNNRMTCPDKLNCFVYCQFNDLFVFLDYLLAYSNFFTEPFVPIFIYPTYPIILPLAPTLCINDDRSIIYLWFLKERPVSSCSCDIDYSSVGQLTVFVVRTVFSDSEVEANTISVTSAVGQTLRYHTYIVFWYYVIWR